ncbi:MAG: alpha/beta fold hydrolase [Thermoanaerobaculia bacterium]
MSQRSLRNSVFVLLAWCWAGAGAGIAAKGPTKKPGDLTWQPYVLETTHGEKVDAELGTLQVLENHARPEGRLIEISFVRLKSLSPHPGPPIVYLAGGPGGSGIDAARGPRYPLFAALRQVADVIALDQRGVGLSAHVLMLCRESWFYPVDRPGDLGGMIALARQHSQSCAEFLAKNQFAAASYNNDESADDLEDLRRALGAPRLDLWGVSYGTSLAFTMLRRHPDRVHRAVLAGIEGPGQELRLPGDVQKLLEQVDRLVQADPAAHGAVPDFLGTVRTVLDRLGTQPVTVAVLDPLSDRKDQVTAGRFDLQMMTAQALASSEGIRRLPGEYLRMSKGDFSALSEFVHRRRKGWLGQAMPYLVACSLGTPPERWARILKEEKETLLGRTADFPYPEICEGWGLPAPRPETWSPVRSQVPVLLISGTLDGRTPPRNADEVAKGLPHAVRLLVENAGHGDDLLLASPAIREAMAGFLGGGRLPSKRIALGPFRFDPVPAGTPAATPAQ